MGLDRRRRGKGGGYSWGKWVRKCWRFVLAFVLVLDALIFVSYLLSIEGLQGVGGVEIGGSAYFKLDSAIAVGARPGKKRDLRER